MNVSTVLIEDVGNFPTWFFYKIPILKKSTDGDGENEIVLGTNDGSVYIYQCVQKETERKLQLTEREIQYGKFPSCNLWIYFDFKSEEEETEPSPTMAKVINLLGGIMEIMSKAKPQNNEDLLALKSLQEFKDFGSAVRDLQNVGSSFKSTYDFWWFNFS